MGSVNLHKPADKSTDCDQELMALCDAVHYRDAARIAKARDALRSALGGNELKLVDSICVISFFNGLADRIADSTNLRLEPGRMMGSMMLALQVVQLQKSTTWHVRNLGMRTNEKVDPRNEN